MVELGWRGCGHCWVDLGWSLGGFVGGVSGVELNWVFGVKIFWVGGFLGWV